MNDAELPFSCVKIKKVEKKEKAGTFQRIVFHVQDPRMKQYSTRVIIWQPDPALFTLVRNGTIVDMICRKGSFNGLRQWTCVFINPQLTASSFRYLVNYTQQLLELNSLTYGQYTPKQVNEKMTKTWRKVMKGKNFKSNLEKLEFYQDCYSLEYPPTLIDITEGIMNAIFKDKLWEKCDLFWRFQYVQWLQRTPKLALPLARAIVKSVKKVPFHLTFEETTIEVFKTNPWTCHISLPSGTKGNSAILAHAKMRRKLLEWLQSTHDLEYNNLRLKELYWEFWKSFHLAQQNDQDTFARESSILKLLGNQNICLTLEQILKLGEEFNDEMPLFIESTSVRFLRDATFYDPSVPIKKPPDAIWQKLQVRNLENRLIELVCKRLKTKSPLHKLKSHAQPSKLFNSGQRQAFFNAFNSISFIQGPAGSGKTFVMRELLDRAAEKGVHGLALAHYNKAVENLKSRGIENAQTCCTFVRNRTSTHPSGKVVWTEPYRFILIDEAGVIPLWLMVKVLECIPPMVPVCFVGDRFQLPPIGHCSAMPFEDFVKALPTHTTVLTEVKRTKSDSSILRNAKSVLARSTEIQTDHSFEWTPQELLKYTKNGQLDTSCLALSTLREIFSRWDVADSMCLTARNQDVLLLASYLHHRHLDSVTDVCQPSQPFVHRCNVSCVQVGTRVMFTQNLRDFKHHNFKDRKMQDLRPGLTPLGTLLACKGDIGVVLDKRPTPRGILFKVRVQQREFECLEGSFVLGYAATIHKCQGSEFPSIFLVLPDAACPLLESRFLYVGQTRATRYLKLVGPKGAYERGIRRGFVTLSSTLSRLSDYVNHQPSKKKLRTG